MGMPQVGIPTGGLFFCFDDVDGLDFVNRNQREERGYDGKQNNQNQVDCRQVREEIDNGIVEDINIHMRLHRGCQNMIRHTRCPPNAEGRKCKDHSTNHKKLRQEDARELIGLAT